MALVETEALVLRTYNLAEADKIVVCLSRAMGLIRGVAKGCRRLKSRYGAAFEPFTLINLSYRQKENQELVSIGQVEIVRSSFDLLSEPVTLAGLAYMGELVIEFSPPYQANDNLFRMVKACIEAITEAPGNLQSVTRYFEVWLLRLEGFLPDVQRCADCHRVFAEDENVFVGADSALRCVACGAVGVHALPKKVHAQLRAVLKFGPAQFASQSRVSTERTNRELAQFTQKIIGRVLEREMRTKPGYVPLRFDLKPEDARY